MHLAGHALVWGNEGSNPAWFNTDCVDEGDGLPNSCDGIYYGNWTPAQKRQIIADHIYNDTQHYNNTMAAWDVANEALCDCQPMVS